MRSLGSALAALVISVFLSSTGPAFGQCTKDTDCKGNRICVKGSCIDPGPSANAPQPSDQHKNEPLSRPTESEVKACVGKLESLGRMYGSVVRVEYGAVMLSQGGMTEMELGAPNGTSIYPVRVRFHDYRTAEAWIYRDPFGTLKCAKHGNIDYAPPATPEEMAAAIKEGETVRVPVKLLSGYAPNSQFVTGTLAVSTKSLLLTVPQPSHGFEVTMDHVYPVDSQNWQLHLDLEVTDPYRHNLVTQSVYFWDPAVQQGRGNSIDCSRCGNAMPTLLSLIKLAHDGQ